MNVRVPAACLLLALRVFAADVQQLSAMLDEAERIRPNDKVKSRELLDAIERDPLAQRDPTLIARVQLLECGWADEPAAAYRAFAKGIAAAERAGSVPLRAKLTRCRANALVFDGRNADAEREYIRALALARQAHDAKLESDLLRNIGYLQYDRGAMADALANVQSAYRISGGIGDRRGQLDALSMIANVYADAHVGQYDRAIEYYRQLLDDYEKHGEQADVADSLFNLGSTFDRKNEFGAAADYFRRALAIYQKLGKTPDVAYTNRALALALTKQGRAAEALPLLDSSLAYYSGVHDAEGASMTRQYRGMALRRLGRLDEALRELDAARRFYENGDNVRYLEKNMEETALAYEKLGDWRNAYIAATRHGALQQKLAETRRDELSSRLRVEFDAEKKDQENRALLRENALRERSQKLQVVVIALTALLAAALAILFWRQVANTRRMRAMAMTDELTRLPNRRHILAAAGIALDAARRDARPAAVIVFDIDRFKRINDTYGHAAGDTVLQSVARACRLELRAFDQLGRIGGEEFLVVLHNATAPQAADVAERLRAAVERLDFTSIDPTLRVTISLGVYVANEYNSTAALAAADSLLYRAKEGGRNRVEMEVAST